MQTPFDTPTAPNFERFEIAATRGAMQAGGQPGAGNSAALLDVVQGINFDALFENCDPRDIARRLLARAYWHPSGFVRTQLFTSTRDRPEIRLHHWRRANPGACVDEAIHEHPWDSLSVVLEGRVVNEFWRIESGSDLPISYFETADVASARYCALGACSARLLSQTEIGPGEWYSIPSGCFHRTRLVSDSAITLFVRGPFLRLFSLMAAQRGPATYAGSQQAPIDPRLIDAMVSRLRSVTAGDGLRSVRPADGVV